MAADASALEHWQKLEGLLQEWLRERQMLLQQLGSIRNGGSIRDLTALEQQVQKFCEVLMDYISAGYFEIYRELAREARLFKRRNSEMTQRILSRLEDSTDEALSFNDDFDSPEHIEEMIETLPQRLSRLTAKLEERFALEDQLVVSIHQQEPPRIRVLH